jgi:two-component system LytT family sensor kinase
MGVLGDADRKTIVGDRGVNLSAPETKKRRPAWITALLVAGGAMAVWFLVGMLDTSWYVLLTPHNAKSPGWLDVFDWNLPYWITAGLLTIPIIWLARRMPLTRGRNLRVLAVHLPSMLAFAVLHTVAFRMLRHPSSVDPFTWEYLHTLMVKFAAGTLDKEIFLYVSIAGAVYALDYRRFRERERAAAALEVEQARLTASLSEARLGALKMQLQPHFLFNALHAISTLIMRGDAQAAHQMLLHLSQFLRMTLDRRSGPEIPLALELEFLDAYLRIQRARFGDRLRVEIEIEPEALQAAVPHLVLQPLVENSIRHGIGSDPGRGRIAIRGTLTDGRLRLEVEDDGVGLRSDRIRPEGVGLANIRERLQHLYPEYHRFQLEDAPQGGTRAILTIPYRLLRGDHESDPRPDRG